MPNVNNEFYVIVDEDTKEYLKKSPSSSVDDYLTWELGEARIFKSFKMAKVGFTPDRYRFGNRLKIVKMNAQVDWVNLF